VAEFGSETSSQEGDMMLRGPQDEEPDEVMTEASEDSNENSIDEEEE
jgi:hypothetical protein